METDRLRPCPFCSSSDVDASFLRHGSGADPGCRDCGECWPLGIWERLVTETSPQPPEAHGTSTE